MRPSLIFATFLTSVTAAGAVVLGPPGIASADQSPQEAIGQLEDEGYDVHVDRVGSGPLDECVVTSVRDPQTQTMTISGPTMGDTDSSPLIALRTEGALAGLGQRGRRAEQRREPVVRAPDRVQVVLHVVARTGLDAQAERMRNHRDRQIGLRPNPTEVFP